MTVRRALPAVSAALLGLALAAPAALAHGGGVVEREDAPIPAWLAGWAAALVLVLSFVALAALWQRPLLQHSRAGRRLFRVPIAVDVVCGAIGVALFALVVYAGIAGTQIATDNFAPTFINVVFWPGLVLASLLFGDVFALFNPWRAIARAVAWVARKVSGGDMPAPLEYPAWLGRWPAALTILAYVWVELASGDRDSPEFLALLALAYAAVQLVGMSLWGIDRWNERADGFAVYYNLFARISPFGRRDGVLYLRIPLSDLPGLAVLPGTVALLCAMIGSTSFDGLSGTGLWIDVAPDIQKVFIDLGMDLEGALEATYSVGLLMMVLLVGALYWLGVLGTRLFEREFSLGELAGSFIHSFVPIAAAYVIAHYFSLMVFGGQAMIDLTSDPLGDGSNLLGGANTAIDYRVIGVEAISLVQTGALVLGHVAGLMLAHDRATALFPEPGVEPGTPAPAKASAATVLFVGVVGAVFNQRSARSQLCMLIVMVAFTSLGIWLLAAQE